MRIRGRATAHMDEAERAVVRLSTLGFVFQFHFLLPEFSALENVALPMKALGERSEDARHDRAVSLLASLGDDQRTPRNSPQAHGTPLERVSWFLRGYQTGSLKACKSVYKLLYRKKR